MAATSSWAAAVECEATAVQLALACLHLTSDVSLHALFSVDGLNWVRQADIQRACDNACRVNPLDFCIMLGLESDALDQAPHTAFEPHRYSGVGAFSLQSQEIGHSQYRRDYV